MRQLASFALALALGLPLISAAQATAGFDATYAGQSAFLALAPGERGTLTAFFANTGTVAWARGTATQVDLAACRDDKVTCDAQDVADAALNGGWLGATRYATHAQAVVAPGGLATFAYPVAVPAGEAPATHRLNGALVVSATGADLRDEGYYQDVQVTAPPAGPDTVSPVYLSLSATGNALTLAFSEDVCATAPLPSRDVSYGVNGGLERAARSAGGDLVISGLPPCFPSRPTQVETSIRGARSFTVFAQAPFADGDEVALTFLSVSGRLVDLSGNPVGAERRQARAVADDAPPRIVSAVPLAYNVIRLIYSERVACDGYAPSQFIATPIDASPVTAVGLTCDPGILAGSGGSALVVVTFISTISPEGFEGTLVYTADPRADHRVKDLVGFDAISPQAIGYSGYEPRAPLVVSARVGRESGLQNVLDPGDVLLIAFDAEMDVSLPDNIVLDLSDEDGTTLAVTCTDEARCQWNTVETRVGAGFYAPRQVLIVTITAAPEAVASGTIAGIQIPATIVDLEHVTDRYFVPPDIAASPVTTIERD